MVNVMNGTIRYTIRPYDTIWMLAQVFNTTVDDIMELNPGIDPRNLQIGQVVSLSPGYQNVISPSNPEDIQEEMDDDVKDVGDMEDLLCYFHMLWEQHVVWTRMAVMAIIHDLPEKDMIIERLLRNPQDFAKALSTFYGEEAANQFAELFTKHLTIAAELVQAAKAGDNTAVTDADQRWHENAQEIAALLNKMNPNWQEDDWNAMLFEHLDLLSNNISQMLEGNYQESINGFDEIERQALEMADMMAEGIAMQFPA